MQDQNQANWYHPLTSTPIRTSFSEDFVTSLLPPSIASSAFESKVKGKSLLMDDAPEDPTIKAEKRKERSIKRATRRAQPLSCRERKRMGLDIIPEEMLRFDLYIPLHSLWTQYIVNVIEGVSDPISILNKLVKADYHGALMTVTRSKCPSLVGHSGIVLKDTENMLYLITRSHDLKKIPKVSSVFTFMIAGRLYTLYGHQFMHRPGERINKKIKNKHSVELPA